jgi:hypothetical protein
MNLLVERKQILRHLITLTIILAISHVVSQSLLAAGSFQPQRPLYTLLQKFDLNGELALGSWYAQAGLLMSAGLLALVGVITAKANGSYVRHWYGLAGVFVYLSFDEATAVHELAVEPVRSLLGIQSGPLYFAWVVPALVILCVLGLVFVRFWVSLPRQTKRLFALAATLFLLGALVTEMIGAAYYAQNPEASFSSAFWMTQIVVEESLELLGAAVFIYGLLDYLEHLLEGNHLKISLK